MPNSGTVTAGSAALASQYNNLRDDVLNVSTGHTHTGASENGAQIEGTVIKSTGASSGAVLTANGSGGATFTALSQSGAVSMIAGTGAFSTATNGGSVFFYTSGPTGASIFATTDGGTVILHSAYTTFTTNQTIYRRAIESNTIVASTALAPATAGTTTRYPYGYGWSAGTAFVVLETGKNVSTHTVTIRKLNSAMTSVMWSTQLFTGGYTGSSYDSFCPMSPVYGLLRYASGPGIWYGGDRRSYQHTAGTAQEAKIWVINDVSGSAYSAAFGSAPGTANSGLHDVSVEGVLFVPSSTAATSGTIHAWGLVGYKPRYCTYSVGSASITALSTADGTYGGGTQNLQSGMTWPAPLLGSFYPQKSYWFSTEALIGVFSANNFTLYDRTFSSAVYTQKYGVNLAQQPNAYNIDAGAFDFTSRRMTDGAVWYQMGTVDGNFMGMGSGLAVGQSIFNNYYGTLAGNGSATHWFNSHTAAGGTVQSIQMAGVARISLGTAASKREITLISPDPMNSVMAVESAGGYQLGLPGQYNSSYTTQQPISFIAGTGEVFVTLRMSELPANSNTMAQPQPNLASGGTTVVRAIQKTLA